MYYYSNTLHLCILRADNTHFTSLNLLKPVLYLPRVRVRDVKIIIGGCTRRLSADIHVPPIFCDHAYLSVGYKSTNFACACCVKKSVATHTFRRYNNIKTARCAVTLGNCLFMFVYCLLRMYVTFLHSGPPAYTFGSINTVDRVRAVCVRVQIEHAERITQPLDAKIAGSLRLLLFLASTFDHCFDKTLL